MNESVQEEKWLAYELRASAQERKSIGRGVEQCSQDGSMSALVDRTASDQG